MTSGPRFWSRLPWREVCATLPAVMLLGVIGSYYIDFVSDDAYISFRYAEHLATGQGLEWNPGYRVEGYSNFLWVVALAGLHLLGLPVPEAGGLLSWLAAAVTLVLIVVLVRRERPRANWAVMALAPLPVVLGFPYQWWTAMRLETAGVGMLLLLSVVLFAREERGGSDQASGVRKWPSAIAYLCLGLIRPEGPAFFLVPLVFLLAGVRSRADLRQLLRERWSWLAIWAVGLAVYHLWRLAYFGDIFPNTYYAKVGGNAFEDGWIYLKRFVSERPYHVILLCGALLVGGISRTIGLLLGTLLVLILVVVFEGGDWMREWRLFMPGVPLVAAALGCGLQRAVDGARREGPLARGAPERSDPEHCMRRWKQVSVLTGAVILCVGLQATMGTPLKEWWRALHGERRDLLINMEGEMTRVSRRVGLWLKRNTRPTDLIAVNHAGAVPFYSDRPVLDMAGLNDRHIAHIQGPVHTKWDASYVLKRKPAFVVLNTKVYPTGWKYVPGYWKGETALVLHPEFIRNYEPVKKIWSWRGLALNVRDYPYMASSYHIMVYRRAKGRLRKLSCLDFESGTFKGWTVSGDAFGKRPESSKTRPGGRPEAYLGRHLADSYRRLDHRKGELRSDPFTIKGERIELLVGGGVIARNVGVRLLVDGDVKFQVAGADDHQIRLHTWDVAHHRGEQAVFEVYDQSSGPWGHILVDNLCQYTRSK